MSRTARTTVFMLLAAAGAATQAATESSDVIALRAEARQLEQQMYEVYNRLNSNDDFDVACDEYKVTGSTIPQWQCSAAFMRNASSQSTTGMFHNRMAPMSVTQDGFVPESQEQIAFKSRRKIRELNDDMMTLARQHQELAAAMIAFDSKRKQLENLEK